MRVLLIEDEATTSAYRADADTCQGFNVYSTDLGEEGLDLGKLYDYDIILLDLNLPTCTVMMCSRSCGWRKVKRRC